MDNHKQHKEDFCAVWSQSDCKLSVYILGDCKNDARKTKQFKIAKKRIV